MLLEKDINELIGLVNREIEDYEDEDIYEYTRHLDFLNALKRKLEAMYG